MEIKVKVNAAGNIGKIEAADKKNSSELKEIARNLSSYRPI